MGTHQGYKLAFDTSEESVSADSLSFAGLVSIQDQQPKSPAPNNQNKQQHYYQESKQDSDFEFATIKSDFNNAARPLKFTPADVLISNGQIKPHAIAFQPNRPFTTNNNNAPISLRSLLATEHISSKMSSGQRSSTRNHKSKERSTVTRTWFGQKVFRSFLTPCRKCQAIQPEAVKGQTVPGEKRCKIK